MSVLSSLLIKYGLIMIYYFDVSYLGVSSLQLVESKYIYLDEAIALWVVWDNNILGNIE